MIGASGEYAFSCTSQIGMEPVNVTNASALNMPATASNPTGPRTNRKSNNRRRPRG